MARGSRRSPDLAGEAAGVFPRVGQESVPDAVEQLHVYFSVEARPREQLLRFRVTLAVRRTGTDTRAHTTSVERENTNEHVTSIYFVRMTFTLCVCGTADSVQEA